jgi:response regulator RpfG family c-di-GMP phosphodiesterase
MDKILVVDDNPDLLLSVQEFLQLHHFEVISCSKASQVSEHFVDPNSSVKLILSDIVMPEKDGLQLFKEFKASPLGLRGCPYVLMTGAVDYLGVEEAYKMGVDELLAKPFELDTLLLVINYLLKKDFAFGPAEDKYFAVRIDDFMHTRNNDFNLYIKVGDKFVLITKSGQEYTPQRLSHFLTKGLQHIYLNNNDFAKYTDMQFVIAKKISQRPIDVARRAKIMNHLVGSVSRSVIANKVDSELLSNAIASFEAFTQLSVQNPQIEKILTQMIQASGDLSERCSHTALLSSMVASSWGWNSGKVQSRIILSGLLCDIGLREHPHLITKLRIDYTEAEKKQYEQHPMESFNTLKQIPDIPVEISLVALEHHENAMGLGFPQKLNRTKVHTFSKIIHCVIQFLETLYFQKDQSNIQAALDQMLQTQAKLISLQVLKTLYKVFNVIMPKQLIELQLPNEVMRVT